MVTTTNPISVDMTEGWVCEQYGYWYCDEGEHIWTCDCEEHDFPCVGCGTVEVSADGKVYFYLDQDNRMQFVCWDCVRGPDPRYVRLLYGQVI